MPKFVWEMTSQGHWSPQLFHGELPREMTMPHNAGRYVVHELPHVEYENAEMYAASCECSVFEFLGQWFPPPPPFTGKETSDAI